MLAVALVALVVLDASAVAFEEAFATYESLLLTSFESPSAFNLTPVVGS